MALARTLVATADSTVWDIPLSGANNTEVTGSFTPANGSLLVAIAMIIKTDTPGDGGAPDIEETPSMGITDSAGLTWTERVARGDEIVHSGSGADHAAYACGLKIWTAPVVTGTSMTVTFQRVSPNAYLVAYCWGAVIQVTGQHASPIGVTGHGEKDTDGFGNASGALTFTLSGTPAASSIIFGARGVVSSATGTFRADPPTGYTELLDVSTDQTGGFQVQVRDAGSTSTTYGWDEVNDGTAANPVYTPMGLALEIKEAAGDASATPSVIAVSVTVNAPTKIDAATVSTIAVSATVNTPVKIVGASPSVISISVVVNSPTKISTVIPSVVAISTVVNAPTDRSTAVSGVIAVSVTVPAVTIVSSGAPATPGVIAVSVSVLAPLGLTIMTPSVIAVLTIVNDSTISAINPQRRLRARPLRTVGHPAYLTP